ncbi:MAG: hypothetical protein KDE53_12155 [Caldilineaceae bacterium]|nr:hypothetical protein [Caldilineaceae bacterium]
MSHRRALQLFTLLLLIATAVTVTVYLWRYTHDDAALATSTSTPFPASVERTASTSSSVEPHAPTLFVEAVAADADNFNPIYSTNPTSLKVIEKIYPLLIGRDPYTGANNSSGLAEKWQFSPDGRTLTITLYPNLQWSDGEPIRAEDIVFTLELVRDPLVASPYRQNFGNIETITAIDDQTLVIQLANPDCAIFQSLRQPILPAHLYHNDRSEFRSTDPNRLPTVGAGPFLFASRSGSRIVLQRNERYRLGAPLLERYEFHIIADEAEQLAGLADGRIDLVALSTEQLAFYQPIPAVTLYKTPLDSITFLALNLANPQHPQPGRASDGSLLPQEPHPILGTLAVRQALAHALDYETLLEQGFQHQILRHSGYLLPTITWAYHKDLAPYGYDPELTAQLLSDAGWVDADGDGIRERDGAPLQLTLLTNEDSTLRARLAELIRLQFQAVGIDLQVAVQPFDLLTNALLGQRYDMVLIGWDTLGAEPGNSDFWLSQQDLPTEFDDNGIGGANFTSYQNVAVDLWLTEARTHPSCDGGYRTQRYQQVQERIYADLPYIVLGSPYQGWVYRAEWQGITPQPWSFAHNIQRWWRAD